MTSAMINLDATNQQLYNMREKLDRVRTQTTLNEENLSDLQSKNEKLIAVAHNYNIDPSRVKDYLTLIN